ncbi:hypothetical protein [Allobranchiibius huperziae]|uniref:Uncharacterized protein n=1 Tax=Allobranchiibius huperziae TaxID=1874116 RepID=A0A853DKU7_9MICO|nr:hypothetical protein [Allobranchiibius huperziae]NYJ75614.1 hypothetical protein [Allobranchiibius huperziae]
MPTLIKDVLVVVLVAVLVLMPYRARDGWRSPFLSRLNRTIGGWARSRNAEGRENFVTRLLRNL